MQIDRNSIADQEFEDLYSRLNNVVNAIEKNNFEKEDSIDLFSPSTDKDCYCYKIFNHVEINNCNLCGKELLLLKNIIKEKTDLLSQNEILEKENKILAEEIERGFKNLDLPNKEALDEKNNQIIILNSQVNQLKGIIEEQTKAMYELRKSKNILENELEELTGSLFDEANKMVANESQKRYNCETEQKRLEEEVTILKNKLYTNQLQTSELKSLVSKSSNIPLITTSNDSIDNEILNLNLQDQNIADEEQIEHFQEFLGQLMQIKNINQTSYIKKCLEQDIEPCLKFGSIRRLKSHKVIDWILHDLISLKELVINSTSSVFSNVSNDGHLKVQSQDYDLIVHKEEKNEIECGACGKISNCKFIIKFKTDHPDILIDKICKDKIQSTIDFYSFIREIQSGKLNKIRVDELYTSSLRLRLRMFYARLGILPADGIEVPTQIEFVPIQSRSPLLEELKIEGKGLGRKKSFLESLNGLIK